MSAPIRLFILNDHPFFLKVLAALFEDQPDMTVVGTARATAETVAGVKQLRPDVVVLDPEMGDLGVGDCIRALRAARPQMGIIVLTMHDLEEYRQVALEAGADAFVAKTTAHVDLLPIIRQVAKKAAG